MFCYICRATKTYANRKEKSVEFGVILTFATGSFRAFLLILMFYGNAFLMLAYKYYWH